MIGQIAKDKLGCNVDYPEVKEEVGWQGMASGDIDTVVENWGHADLVKKYITEQKSVEDAGLTGNEGLIGWFVPPVDGRQVPRHHRLEQPQQVRRHVQDLESGGQGQLLDGDPSYVTNDEALVKNLDLNYQVVVGGSEAALLDELQERGEEQDAAARVLLHPAVVRRVDGASTPGVTDPIQVAPSIAEVDQGL